MFSEHLDILLKIFESYLYKKSMSGKLFYRLRPTTQAVLTIFLLYANIYLNIITFIHIYINTNRIKQHKLN